jgi:GxxExxY protein
MDLQYLNELSHKIRGAFFKVHGSLGPGLLESVYVAALTYELSELNLSMQTQIGSSRELQWNNSRAWI